MRHAIKYVPSCPFKYRSMPGNAVMDIPVPARPTMEENTPAHPPPMHPQIKGVSLGRFPPKIKGSVMPKNAGTTDVK